jgi:hypothetical protein
VFPEAYRKCSSSLVKEEAVVVIGRLNKKDLNPKIVADDVVPLERADASILEVAPPPGTETPPRKPISGTDSGEITITLEADADEDSLLELKEILAGCPGSSPVRLIFCRENGREIVAEIESALLVACEENLLRKIRAVSCVTGASRSASGAE